MNRRLPRRAGRRKAFTLLEMMLVVVIIGLLATVVVINFAGQTTKALTQTTKASLSQIKGALTTYATSNGGYPPDLATLKTSKELERVPVDGWKKDFVYIPNTGNPDKPFELYSLGPDGQGGTPDDIDVWTMENR